MRTQCVFYKAVVFFLLWYPTSLAAQSSPIVPEVFGLNVTGPTSSKVCQKCHKDIYDTWSNSMHFQSYSDPIFQIAFLEAQVKRGRDIRRFCLQCHTPLTQINKDFELHRSVTTEGITCDFCHSITKTNINNMEKPYEFDPGVQKYGPIKDASSPAHKTYYSDLHTRSEFCGGCHQLINDHGVLVMGTYTEWSEGYYAKANIQCQNCHMPIEFDLKVVKPEIKKVDHYVTAHKFQGGHSEINVRKAASLQLFVRKKESNAEVSVFVTNAESGHKIPTGTPARKINLLVQVEDEKGKSIGQASKTYEKVLVDQDGQILENNAAQILDAVRILSDNRIAPKETRKEEFSFIIPEGVKKISATAELKYIFETPVLQKSLMATEMTKATVTYNVEATKKEITLATTEPGFITILIIVASVMFMVLLYFILRGRII